MLGARSVAGNRFDTFTEKSHSLRWAATRVLYCPWDWRTPSDRRNSAQTPTSAGFRRVSHRSRIVHIAGMAPKWTVRSVCSCTLSLSGARAALLPWSASGLCRDQDLASVDGPLCRGLQRQTRRVLAVGLPVRRQRPADELPGAVGWRGRYRNRQGWHVVDSCDGHVDDKLVGVTKLCGRSAK